MPWRRGWRRHGFLSARSAGKPWVSEMEPLQVSMAERTNRRKHWGNPVILQHWPIINTQSRGRKPLLILKSILRAGKGVHTTQNYCYCAPLFFALITEYLLFRSQLSPSRFFFCYELYRKAISGLLNFFLYIFSKCLESLGDWCPSTAWGRGIKVWMARAEVLWITGNQ